MPTVIARQFILVSPSEEPSDAALIEALEQIPTNNGICQIQISTPIRRDWPLFYAHLATRENLDKVVLSEFLLEEHLPSSDAEIRSVLKAVQQDRATRKVRLHRLRPSPSTVVRFLDAANRLTEFQLCCGTMLDEENGDCGPKEIAAALQRHPNLQYLFVSFQLLHDAYMIAILKALLVNRVLQKRKLSMHTWSEVTHRTFQELMFSTTTIRELHIHRLGDKTKQDFLQISRNKYSLRTLTVNNDNNFFNVDDQRLLQSYFRRNESLELYSSTTPQRSQRICCRKLVAL